MWIRTRLDIGWGDLCRGLFGAIVARDNLKSQKQLEQTWSAGAGDALACQSVRSAFDLLLQVLDLPPGSEVLFSAVTIPDMIDVAKAHRLVPVPVDVIGADYNMDIDSLSRAITPRSKMLVVAHLFGARPDMTAVCQIGHEHGLFVVEDCAQAWAADGWRGSVDADASLFSFGAIKTATALGGALARVGCKAVLLRMRALQEAYPIQSQRQYASQIVKFAILKAISTRFAFGALVALGARRGRDVDAILGGLTRDFPPGDLMSYLRRQPCAALLDLLRHRLQSYDSGRVARRIANARRIIERLQLEKVYPELLDEAHTFWLFPNPTDRPEPLIERLRQHGFDSTQRGRLQVVPAPEDRPEQACRSAPELLRRAVFLPCYPEMPPAEIDVLCDVVDEVLQGTVATRTMDAAATSG